MRGMVLDEAANCLWMHSGKALYHLYLEHEEKDLWLHFLKVSRIKDAYSFCERKNPKHKPLVAGMYADELFENGNYWPSVDYYVVSNKSFEEVALKFLNLSLLSPLQRNRPRITLLRVPREVPGEARAPLAPREEGRGVPAAAHAARDVDPRAAPQRDLEDQGADRRHEARGRGLAERVSARIFTTRRAIIKNLQEEMWAFLKEHEDDIEKTTLYQILQSHGKIDECIEFAEKVNVSGRC